MRNRFVYQRVPDWIKYLLMVITLTIIICFIRENFMQYQKILKLTKSDPVDQEIFRELHISESAVKNIVQYSVKTGKDEIQILTVNILLNHYRIEESSQIIFDVDKIKGIKKLKDCKVYQELYEKYKSIFHDLKFFPVPLDFSERASCYFDNSWNTPRTYGGKRTHEGTDIMTSNNERGYFPVLSMTDGVVEQKGWLEKGGYRIGIRSESGAYFYYAHLHSYTEGIEIGSKVKAGDIIGRMGDTGYSKIEGTTGKFDVHLHVGIYIEENGKEMSLNPYWILKYLELNKQLKFNEN